MLTIWGRANSANVQKVMWLVGEIALTRELAHEHVELGGKFGGLDAPSFLAMNPHGRVPVIRDGEIVVWESHAILRYLAATYAPELFWSDAPGRRSEIDRWMDWSQTSLQPDFLGGVFWGFYRTPAPLRDARAIARSVAACAGHVQLLDRWLDARPFLAGDALTLADIPAGALLYRYFELDIERPQAANVEAWYARLREREAYQRHVMIPFADLFGRLDF